MLRLACRVLLCGALFVPATALAQDSGPACGNISKVGCCVDDTHSQYCSSGVLKAKTCKGTTDAGTPNVCGWSSTYNDYTCTTSTGSDPKGTYPRLCKDLPDGGPIPVADAGAKKDTGSKYDVSSGIACGSIPSQGCCSGTTTTTYCGTSKSLKTKTCTGSQVCGWDSSKNYYTCTTTSSADPSGTYPLNCSSYSDGGGTTSDTGGTTTDSGGTTSDKGTTTKNDKGTSGGGSKSDSGCSCSVGAQGQDWLFVALLGAALVLLARSRRRRG